MKLLDHILYSKPWWWFLRWVTRNSQYEDQVPSDYEEIRQDKLRMIAESKKNR
jgi:hypothetical protein